MEDYLTTARPVLIILERILVLPCDEWNARFPCAQQRSFVSVVVLLQAKKEMFRLRTVNW